jgi:hypothetical protein
MAKFPLDSKELADYASKSAAVGGVLSSAELTRIAEDYVDESEWATEAQTRFNRVARQLNLSVLITAIIGSLILAIGLLEPWFEKKEGLTLLRQASPAALFVLGVVGLVVGGFSAARLYELNAGDLAGSWLKSRARAENLRGEYFDRLAGRAVALDAQARLVALRIVNAHLLDHQLTYFRERGLRHERAANWWLRWAASASGISSIGVAAGGVAGVAATPWMGVAALGTIGAALAAFATSQESIGQERVRAQRFRNNRAALNELARRLDEIEEAVTGASPEALITFTSGINQQLNLELSQFLDSAESIRASITKLGEEIEKNQKAKAKG